MLASQTHPTASHGDAEARVGGGKHLYHPRSPSEAEGKCSIERMRILSRGICGKGRLGAWFGEWGLSQIPGAAIGKGLENIQ